MNTKILHVLTLRPSHFSGKNETEDCLFPDLFARLEKSGVHNTMLGVLPIFAHKPLQPISSVPEVWLRYFRLPGTYGVPTAGAFIFARIVGLLRDLKRTQSIDLVHAYEPLPCGHAAMLISRELNIPYVVSACGVDRSLEALDFSGVKAWCRRITRLVYSQSRRVLCLSEQIRQRVLEGMGRRCRTSVVYNGVDVELFSPLPEPVEPINSVLSAGEMTTDSGHDLLIRATAALTKEFPAISLEIIGDGPESAHLHTLVKERNLAGVVRFKPRQSRQQIADAMKRCALFVLPSRSDMPDCLPLQAMSSAKAVIGCRGHGIAEIIRHGTNGLLVGPDNERELSLAASMLLREPVLRHNLGIAARDTILDRLTLEQQAENLRRIYQESVN